MTKSILTINLIATFSLTLLVNGVLSASNISTLFDNFTMEWFDFPLWNCAIPRKMNISISTCMFSATYTQVNDIDCLTTIENYFNPNTCEAATVSTSFYNTSLISELISVITTPASTTAKSELLTSIVMNATQPTTKAFSYPITTIVTDILHPNPTTMTTIFDTTTPITTVHTYMNVTTTVVTTTMYNFLNCPDSSYIGTYCNVSANPCVTSEPCENAGTCYLNNTLSLGYYCQCKEGYEGYNCENDKRACKENTCWHNGTCIPDNSTASSSSGLNFQCNCVEGYNGVYCELVIDLCGNITCENRGICYTVDLTWKCLCLDSAFYYGDHCQFKTNQIKIREILSTSFASVAIGVISATCAFVVIMDVLKYCFHVDPVASEREHYRKRPEPQRRPTKPKCQPHIALRFKYIS